MIELDVEPYCENCPDFDADVAKSIPCFTMECSEQVNFIGNTIVRCSRRYACKAIEQTIIERMKNP